MVSSEVANGLAPVEVARRLGDLVGVALIGDAWDHTVFALGSPLEIGDADPFDALDRPHAGLPSAWFGCIGYPAGELLEAMEPPVSRDPETPVAMLARYPAILRPEGGSWLLEGDPGMIPEVRARLASGAERGLARCGDFGATPGRGAHMKAVGTVLDRIASGEFFQVNLTMKVEATFEGDPLELFCRGVEMTSPQRAAFVRRGSRCVVSMSPETFLTRRDRAVATEPIKGTRPDDTDGERELARSSKDRAENIMIVDLMRNDLGRVCEPGSITVPKLCEPQRHPGVWHLVSRIEGRLREGTSEGDLMRASFPPGSVTGAPKIRAMETINELEPWGRQAYTGAIGYACVEHSEWSVAIRAFEIEDDRIWFGVGGGIVADSDPEAEYEECLTKASTLLSIAGSRLIDA
jgi:para-aminobenzoate synthetase / 4-amino-4-deoxychorismate lyase